MNKKSTIWKSIAALSVAGLTLTACGDDAGNGDNGEASGEGGEITIAVFDGWEEGIAVSELWKHVLEENGYTVNLEVAGAAPVFSGLSTGDYDVNFDVWKPITHEEYLDDFGDSLEDLGTWNEEATLHLAVNEDAPIDSLDELAEHADEFGNQIVGIDAGSGLVQITESEVIPTYGLEGMDLTTSSTPAMLQELATATENGENIVVTLWRPHWAYEGFPIKDLEDPEDVFGEGETMSTYAREGFSEEFPQAAEWFENFEMDTDTLHDLENVLFNENEGASDYAPIIEEWVAENQEFVDGMTS